MAVSYTHLGRVIYVGTFSKVLFGSLRLAYLVLPRPLMDSFCRARAAVDGHSNQLQQAVTADFIRGGHFATHLRQSRLLYQSRRDLLLAELAEHCPGLTPIHSGAGLQCAVLLPPGGEARWTNDANTCGLGLRLSLIHISRLEMLEMVFLKADLWLAEYYDTRLVPENLWALGKQLRQELAGSIEVVLKLRPQGDLLDDQPWIKESIKLRNPYTCLLYTSRCV